MERLTMEWNSVTSIAEADTLIDSSSEKFVVFLKHSNRCSISSLVLDRFKRQWDSTAHPDVELAVVDVINNRNVSNHIADKLGVRHESPQLILVKDGKSAYDNSHMGINFAELSREIKVLSA